jgi:hypothetical protein
MAVIAKNEAIASVFIENVLSSFEWLFVEGHSLLVPTTVRGGWPLPTKATECVKFNRNWAILG